MLVNFFPTLLWYSLFLVVYFFMYIKPEPSEDHNAWQFDCVLFIVHYTLKIKLKKHWIWGSSLLFTYYWWWHLSQGPAITKEEKIGEGDRLALSYHGDEWAIPCFFLTIRNPKLPETWLGAKLSYFETAFLFHEPQPSS